MTVDARAITSFHEDREGWDSLLDDSPVGSIFLSPQWQEVWWQNFAGEREMTGFSLVGPDGATGAVASLARLGDSLSFVGSTDTFDYNDFLVRPGFEGTFYPALLDILDGWEWSEFRLDSLLEDSPTLKYLPELARARGYEVESEYEDVNLGCPPSRRLGGVSGPARQEGPPRAEAQAAPAGYPDRMALVLPHHPRGCAGPL